MVGNEKLCPLAKDDVSERLAVYCVRERCAWWDVANDVPRCVLMSVASTLGKIAGCVRSQPGIIPELDRDEL